ncbi:CRISPR-associated endonuclease Cas2 [Bombilactobacillus folatiphilus]|uniref:CRISPR-associated endoribonuclease Cas2 n=1 Tax=Bombilactobacillus folatiphilus TaxID=2923362 RepID=A0ABY4PBA1_9LACO|nr:CRISPR-associated endonuclease Cas2 [Bombilactobacillus folatiphilus]UQS82875.1 CRISPR-associated endonuclease Cas2 [Bombilactobacillus folatiphilus]
MRLLCMFDLPMETKNDQRQYRIFRKALLKNGFTMLQYSVYYRTLPNRAAGKKYEHAIQTFLPMHGEVRLVAVSEKQFNDMKILVGSRSQQEALVGSKKLVQI